MSQTLKLNATTLANIMNKIVTYGADAAKDPLIYSGNVVTYG